MPTYSPYLDELIQGAHPEGGWGYAPDQAAQLEPTCLALLAAGLDPAKYADAIAKGRQFLARCRRSDGGYPLAKGRGEALWSTALVLFTETVLGGDLESLSATAGFLLSYKGRIPKVPAQKMTWHRASPSR